MNQPRPANREEIMQSVNKWRKEHKLPRVRVQQGVVTVTEDRRAFNRNFNRVNIPGGAR